VLPAALTLAFVLSSCVFIQAPDAAPPAATQQNSPLPPTEGSTQDCPDDDVTLNQSGTTYTLTGDCGVVTIAGNDIVVDAGNLEGVRLNGDRLTVTATAVGAITVGGNDNLVTVDDAGGVTINGDRNAVEAFTVFGVTIGGNDNTVHATVTGEIVQNGERNAVGD
jgi:hypothetical protein